MKIFALTFLAFVALTTASEYEKILESAARAGAESAMGLVETSGERDLQATDPVSCAFSCAFGILFELLLRFPTQSCESIGAALAAGMNCGIACNLHFQQCTPASICNFDGACTTAFGVANVTDIIDVLNQPGSAPTSLPGIFSCNTTCEQIEIAANGIGLDAGGALNDASSTMLPFTALIVTVIALMFH